MKIISGASRPQFRRMRGIRAANHFIRKSRFKRIKMSGPLSRSVRLRPPEPASNNIIFGGCWSPFKRPTRDPIQWNDSGSFVIGMWVITSFISFPTITTLLRDFFLLRKKHYYYSTDSVLPTGSSTKISYIKRSCPSLLSIRSRWKET